MPIHTIHVNTGTAHVHILNIVQSQHLLLSLRSFLFVCVIMSVRGALHQGRPPNQCTCPLTTHTDTHTQSISTRTLVTLM